MPPGFFQRAVSRPTGASWIRNIVGHNTLPVLLLSDDGRKFKHTSFLPGVCLPLLPARGREQAVGGLSLETTRGPETDAEPEAAGGQSGKPASEPPKALVATGHRAGDSALGAARAERWGWRAVPLVAPPGLESSLGRRQGSQAAAREQAACPAGPACPMCRGAGRLCPPGGQAGCRSGDPARRRADPSPRPSPGWPRGVGEKRGGGCQGAGPGRSPGSGVARANRLRPLESSARRGLCDPPVPASRDQEGSASGGLPPAAQRGPARPVCPDTVCPDRGFVRLRLPPSRPHGSGRGFRRGHVQRPGRPAARRSEPGPASPGFVGGLDQSRDLHGCCGVWICHQRRS